MSWNVELAKLEEVEEISKLAESYREYVSPYVLNPMQIKAYLNEWLVAKENGNIGGALHFVSDNIVLKDRNKPYLYYLKQVDPHIVRDFYAGGGIFMSQPTCPGKGSLRALVDDLKSHTNRLWCWLSIVSPVIRFYEEQLGFKFSTETYTFMNVYKGDYSTFRVGIWEKPVSER